MTFFVIAAIFCFLVLFVGAIYFQRYIYKLEKRTRGEMAEAGMARAVMSEEVSGLYGLASRVDDELAVKSAALDAAITLLSESVVQRCADMTLAYSDLEARVIALEKFNEEEGQELLEALQEQTRQERLATEGIANVLSYGFGKRVEK